MDVRNTVRKLMVLMANSSTKKRNAIRMRAIVLSPELPRIVAADKQHIRQILINLLSNALKFTSHGSIDLLISVRSAWLDVATKQMVREN